MGFGLTTSKKRVCSHEETLTVNAAGIERVICEVCGHVSIRFHDDVLNDVERAALAREVDDAMKRSLVMAAESG